LDIHVHAYRHTDAVKHYTRRWRGIHNQLTEKYISFVIPTLNKTGSLKYNNLSCFIFQMFQCLQLLKHTMCTTVTTTSFRTLIMYTALLTSGWPYQRG